MALVINKNMLEREGLDGCFATSMVEKSDYLKCDGCDYEIRFECEEYYYGEDDYIDDDSDSVVIIIGDTKKWIYSFPEVRGFSRDISTSKLDEYREKLIKQDDYLIFRDIYCSIMIELNRRFIDSPEGVKSTRFRPGKKGPHPYSGKPYSKADSFSSNDAQIIAMHWHHIRGRRYVDSDDKLAKKIYCSDDFDFVAASEFSVIRGSSEKKAELLGLTLNERWESGSFDDNEMRAQWKSIEKYINKAKVQLKQLAQRNNQMRNRVDEWSDLLIPMLIEEVCMASDGKFSPNNVSKLYQFVTGKTMSRQSAYSKIRSINKHLPDWRKVLGKS